MFSPHDAPSNSAPGNGHSYLDYGSLEFVVTDSDYTDWDSGKTNVDVAVFEVHRHAHLTRDTRHSTHDTHLTRAPMHAQTHMHAHARVRAHERTHAHPPMPSPACPRPRLRTPRPIISRSLGRR